MQATKARLGLDRPGELRITGPIWSYEFRGLFEI